MTLDPGLERPRPDEGEGFEDAVALAFADRRAGVCGLARAGRSGWGASALAVLFRDGEPVAVRAQGGLEAGHDGWSGAAAAGVTLEVLEPHERWRAAFAGDDGGFELEARSLGAPAIHDADSPVAAAGAMEGYEHLCRVRGTVHVGSERIEVDGLGQRDHVWARPDWSATALVRSIGAWLGDELGVVATAVRPAKARTHDAEALSATVLQGAPLAALPIAEPRLSTIYDEQGRQRRAGLELWPPEEEAHSRRAAGELWCGASLELGRLRCDVAFFDWRMEGRQGVGRYDVLRPA